MTMTKDEEIEQAWALYRGDKPKKPPAATVEKADFVPRSEWLKLRLEEQGGRCKYCERRIEPEHADREFRATIDHVVPRRAGGDDTYANVVACCVPCNAIKGGQTCDEFLSDPKLRMRLYETRYGGL